MNQQVWLVDGEAVQIPDFTRDVAGHLVDLRPTAWRLNTVSGSRNLVNLDILDGCDKAAIQSLKIHIVRLIETSSSSHTMSSFKTSEDT
jgi:hypothetical protein